MTVIYKYAFDVQEIFSLTFPAGAEILSVQIQNEQPCMWVLLDEYEERENNRTFEIFGTGHDMPPATRKYIATFQTHPFVWHLFEKNKS